MPMVAIFAAEAAALTAAEIAAAEAAKIAAAEAAAAAAAEVAAQQAAQVAAQQTAQQAATSTAATGGAEALNLAAQQQAAQQAGVMGIEGATASQPLTAEAVQQAAMNQGVFPPTDPASYAQLNIGSNPSAPFPEFFGQGQAMPPQGIADPSLAMQPQNTGFLNSPAVAPGPGPMQYQLNAPTTSGQGLRLGSSLEGITAPTTPMTTVQPPPSALETGMDKALKFAEKNPFTAMTGAYLGANALGLMDPSGGTFNDKKYDGPLSRIRLSPDFQGTTANPADFQYTPRRYAGGGVMDVGPVQAMSDQNRMQEYQRAMTATGGQVANFAKGGSLSDSIEKYQKMMEGEPQAAPKKSADVGIYYDQDTDTRYQDALTAAQIRQAKINQRAYVSPPVAKRPTPMGQLQMDSVKAAQGGVMQSYAEGGITGNGNLNLNIPLNLGGGGAGGGGSGGSFGGYTPVGGGNVNPNTNSGGFGGMLAGMGGTAENGFMSRPGGTGGDGFGGLAGLLGRVGVDGATAGNLMNQLQNAQKRFGGGGMQQHFGLETGNFGRGFSQDLRPGDPQYDNYMRSRIPGGEKFAGFAQGGIANSNLGGYAAGGNPRLLKGPGDGMSDNIPATINGRQPARLADGEFVIPADVVSHLGNGSTEAGAKQLHAMMNKVRKARTGNPKQGKNINPRKYLPK